MLVGGPGRQYWSHWVVPLSRGTLVHQLIRCLLASLRLSVSATAGKRKPLDRWMACVPHFALERAKRDQERRADRIKLI